MSDILYLFPEAKIARAMGAVTVSICLYPMRSFRMQKKDYSKELCPLIKSSYRCRD
ncbi:MAG: hypothetical protein ACLU80_16265 [Dorea sp.]